MKNIKGVVFDLDGTIYIGSQLVEGASEIVNYFRSKNVNLAFVTNNSSKTIEEIFLKLVSLGLDVKKNEIYSSATATALFLKKNKMNDVFVIGSNGLVNELEKLDIKINMTENAKHVVVGMEQNLQDAKLLKVQNILLNQDANLIACNMDMDFPSENGERNAGCGVIVEAVENIAARKADYVIGKPNAYMMDILLDDLDLKAEELLVVGDSYNSDGKFAINTGAYPVLLADDFSPLSDAIVINELKQLKTLFELPEGIQRLFTYTNYENLNKEILSPYIRILENVSDVYLFGARRLGEKIFAQCQQANINVIGFIDNDIEKQKGTFCGRRVFSLSDVKDKNSVIIVSSTYLNTIHLQLKDSGFNNIVPYPVLSLYDENRFPPEVTFKSMQKDLIENKYSYVSMYLKLIDDKSRDTFEKILLFRLTLDSSVLDFKNKTHYFANDIYNLGEQEVFVDCGGYTGDTSLEFIKQVKGKYNKIFIFEPDEMLLSIAKHDLGDYRNIEFILKGVYSKNELLGFNLTGDLDGAIDSSSEYTIQVTSLDSAVEEKITFIKLDVEGAEGEALKGAIRHIKEEEPKLAIACYHKCEDLWHLPSTISKINKNYIFYFRHYSQTSLETVLYCTVKN